MFAWERRQELGVVVVVVVVAVVIVVGPLPSAICCSPSVTYMLDLGCKRAPR
jgi:hypothetical protein